MNISVKCIKIDSIVSPYLELDKEYDIVKLHIGKDESYIILEGLEPFKFPISYFSIQTNE